MEPRLDIMNNTVAAKVVKYLVSANKAAADSALPAATQELMKIRASQINGCGFCLDMHTKDAAKAGETSVRLNLVAAWQEATVFTEAERAEVERLVNEKVYADLPVQARELDHAEAKKLPGVKAFFGDKYGDIVRVVEIQDQPLTTHHSPLTT